MTIPVPLLHPFQQSTSTSTSNSNGNRNGNSNKGGKARKSSGTGTRTAGTGTTASVSNSKSRFSDTGSTIPSFIGNSAGLPDGTSVQGQASARVTTAPIKTQASHRNNTKTRARTSSIDYGSPDHYLSAPRRRNSGSVVSPPASAVDQQHATAVAGPGPSTTRAHRSSTLSTTLHSSSLLKSSASASTRPQLRSRASTNVRLPPAAQAPASSLFPTPASPPSPTSSSASSSATAKAKGRRRAMSSTPRTARQTQHPYRKAIIIFSILVSLFLLGTVIVLSSVSYYLAIPDGAFLTEEEVPWTGDDLIPSLLDPVKAEQRKRQDWEELAQAEDAVLGVDTIPQVWDEELAEATEGEGTDELVASSTTTTASDEGWGIDGAGSGAYWMREDWDGVVRDSDDWNRLYNVTARPGEKIPRIIHQTWKNDQLPEKWRKAWKECREGMPDYEYMLWTDDLAHKFMETHYPSFLQMYDSYKYNIQRADSIRYFLLHHFGGIYMDLDIGCRRRMDELINGDWEVILPITKPVGISNDLMFSSKGSAFIADTIHGLAAFNHEWFSNYPTVMFSTGPMFLSAQYAIYTSAHPLSETHQRHEIRVLPKSLYGKNADPATVPHSFFAHFYGSSWHADDAGFIGFLGKSGITVMWIAGVIVVLLIARLAWQKYHNKGSSSGAGAYQFLAGDGDHDNDYLPTSSPSSPEGPFHIEPNQLSGGDISNAFKRAGNLILTAPATLLSSRGRRRSGLLYFVPAMFQPTPSGTGPGGRRRTASEASQLPLTVRHRHDSGGASDHEPLALSHLPPPPYQRESQDWTLQSAHAHAQGQPPKARKTDGTSSEDGVGDETDRAPSISIHPNPSEQWQTWKDTT